MMKTLTVLLALCSPAAAQGYLPGPVTIRPTYTIPAGSTVVIRQYGWFGCRYHTTVFLPPQPLPGYSR